MLDQIYVGLIQRRHGSAWLRRAFRAWRCTAGRPSPGPVSCRNHQLQPGGNTALGDAEAAVQKAADDLRMPSDVRTEFAGNAKWLQQTAQTEPPLIAAALISIYIVLGVLYESLLHPLTILSTLPSAGVGALLALLITGQTARRHGHDRASCC